MHRCPTCGYRFEDAAALRAHVDGDCPDLALCEHRCSRGAHCGGCGCPGCGFDRETGDPRGPLPERAWRAAEDAHNAGWEWCPECQDLSRPGTGEFAAYCVRCGSELVTA